MALAVGIDLGTTLSAISVIGETGKPELIQNAEGESLTPSVVYFSGSGIIVGKEAKKMQALGEDMVASFFKRVMGDPNWIFPAGDKLYTPADLSFFVLRKLKQDAEVALRESISHAVITVPAYFSELQRRNTIEAGKKAGLEVLRIINEPTAAAISYGTMGADKDAIYLVYDLGGGTFDVSLVKIDEENIEVLATDGNHELGGKDWDDAILRYAAAQFQEEHGLDPLADSISFNDLMVRVEMTKKALSATSRTTILISYGGKTGRYQLTRDTFDQITANLMEMTTNLVDQVLFNAHLSWADLTGTLLVGGSTRMPMVHRYITEKSGNPPLEGVNVDEAVALGAAIQADVDMYSSGWRLPEAKKSTPAYSLAPPKNIKDVTSHSLGMVAINKDRTRYINSRLIPKNNPIPSKKMRTYQFRTNARRANEMEVYITQGESERPLDCTILGKYRFLDIPHNPDIGKAIIDITYAYDHNGVVQVSAVEQSTGTSLRHVVEPLPDDLSWLDEPPEQATTFEHLLVVMAIDLSGSMMGTPLKKAQEAARGFVDKMNLANTSIGLIAFADQVKVIKNPCQDEKEIHEAINSLNTHDVGGGTSAQPFSETFNLFKNKEGLRFLIFLTDGQLFDQNQAIQEEKKCHQEQIQIVAIGFGDADYNFLKSVASSDEGALFTDLNNLAGSFDRVAQVLTERGGRIQLEEGTIAPKKTRILGFFK